MTIGSMEMKPKLSIRLLFAGFAVGVLILMLATFGLLFMQSRKTIDEASERSARGAAENTTRGIVNLIGLLNQSLAGQASDSRLSGVIARAEPSLIRLEEERITHMVPHAWLVRLLPENIDSPDESRSPRMGFSDLNMVRLAVTETAQPAINLANSPDAHLAIVLRLPSGGGVIHASWHLKLLDEAMAAEGACGIELRQDNIGYFYRGGSNCRDKAPSGERSVDGTPWKIMYWANTDLSSSLARFTPAPLGSLALVGGFAFWLIRRLNADLTQDRGSLVSLVNDLQSGYSFGDYRFKLAEFENLANETSKLQRVTRDKKRPESRPKPRAQTVLNIVEKPVAKLNETPPEPESQLEHEINLVISPNIFRTYDILGKSGETLTPDVMYTLGLAIGSEMCARGNIKVAMAFDGRLSSSELSRSLAKGLIDTGRTVINLGQAPTPLLYFAALELNVKSCVMLTGSHHAADFNGLTVVLDGDAPKEADMETLRRRVEQSDFLTGTGKMEHYNPTSEYTERVLGDIQPGRSMKIVMDCGNGVASIVAPELLRSLGCEVIELFCEVDGHFPNHPPNPSKPENLQALIDAVRESEADLGVAFDGDGDRLAIVDSSGKIIWPDRQMMLFAADVLSREPGADIIYDVKCSRHLSGQIVKNGGRPLMWKTGQTLIKSKMKETGAKLAGELNGHIFFQERWFGFADGIYACARMIEILSNSLETSAEVFAQLPDSFNTPELLIPLEEGENFAIMEKLRACADFPNARINEIDGLRVDFLDGWGLVRASNSTPSLTLRFEAESEKALADIERQFKDLLRKVKADIKLPL